MEIKEKHIIEYSCGCKGEIVLSKGGGFWKGNTIKCPH